MDPKLNPTLGGASARLFFLTGQEICLGVLETALLQSLVQGMLLKLIAAALACLGVMALWGWRLYREADRSDYLTLIGRRLVLRGGTSNPLERDRRHPQRMPRF